MARGRPRKDAGAINTSSATNYSSTNNQPKRGRGRPKGSTKKPQVSQLQAVQHDAIAVPQVIQQQPQIYQQDRTQGINSIDDNIYKFVKKITTVFNFISRNIRAIAVSIIILVLACAYLHQLHTNNKLMKNQGSATSTTSQAVTLRNTVGKLIVLPDNEVPTIATVTNSSKLDSESSFFARAVNGDKVLIFSKAKEVILFRPSQNKVVEAAPLDDSTSSATSTSTTSN